MKNVLLSKLKESLISISPIALFVCLMGLTITPLSGLVILQFLVCAVLLVVGMGLFSLGADVAMIPIGEKIGTSLTKTNKVWLMILCAFILGTIITVAEPDLNVLADQVTSVNKTVFIMTVSIGVGIFLVISLLRNLFKIKLSIILAVSYGIIFILAIFVPESFVPLSFDSGSVTTGPISVPFLLAFGVGLASGHSNNAKGTGNNDENFGMIALSSAGPILAVMLISIILRPSQIAEIQYEIVDPKSVGEIFSGIVSSYPAYLKEVAIVLCPILVIFLIFQIFSLKLKFSSLWRILIGLIYALIGISIFLCAVTYGFLPVGYMIGKNIITSSFSWAFIPIFAVLGWLIILAEPAVGVLVKQVETITNGMIKSKMIRITMCLGVAIALALVATRIVLQINLLWIILPIYIVCFILCFIVPPVFVGIAFDSGGVATGAMATTFILPMVIGVVFALESNILSFAFGTLAMIACLPIFSLLMLGLIYKIKLNKATQHKVVKHKRKVEIVEFD